MLQNYKTWLLENGYSEKSGRLLPSTVYSYILGIKHTCKYENISIEQLAENINAIAPIILFFIYHQSPFIIG